MTPENISKYFHPDDMLCYITGDHPLKSHFEECNATNYVKRSEFDVKELIFRCMQFGGLHIIRECKDNCPKFNVCKQITKVMKKEAIIKMLYPLVTE